MKRSPLKRTEWNRKPSQLKRTRLKPMSSKRRKLMNEVGPERRAYLAEHPNCACCGQPASCVHEIASGPARDAALGERCAWLATCWDCNAYALPDKVKWPIERQLCVKAASDPEYYDRRRVNVLRGRSPEAISEVDVLVVALGRNAK